MYMLGVDADQAFAVLARMSQEANVKVRDVAAQLGEDLTVQAGAQTRQARLDALSAIRDRLTP
jgi:hypothetical protein